MHLNWTGHGFPTVILNAKNMAIELHQLLKQGGEKEPFVLVAASVAGFYARQYVDAFPAEVAALVLIDSSTPEQIAEISGSEYLPELIKRKHCEVRLEWWKEASGRALVSGGCARFSITCKMLDPNIFFGDGELCQRLMSC